MVSFCQYAFKLFDTARTIWPSIFTLDQAYPFVYNKLVAFGFPDIMCSPQGCLYSITGTYQEANQGDVVLALFPAHNPECHGYGGHR